jgi:hypothetical protein
MGEEEDGPGARTRAELCGWFRPLRQIEGKRGHTARAPLLCCYYPAGFGFGNAGRRKQLCGLVVVMWTRNRR